MGSIGRLTQRLCAYWNSGDLERFMDCYERCDTVSLIAKGKRIEGWEMLYHFFSQMFAHGERKGLLNSSNERIAYLAQNCATCTFDWTLVDGGRSLTGVCSLVLRKTEGEWRIVLDHS